MCLYDSIESASAYADSETQIRCQKTINGSNMPIRVQILLLPETMLSTLIGPLDLLSTAGSLWPLLMGTQPQTLFDVELISCTREPMYFAGGLTIHPQKTLDQAGPADVIYVPSIFIMPDGDLPPSVSLASHWLSQQHKRGATLCSACTGAFVLAETGLLKGLPATTHWAFGELFKRKFSDVQFKNNAVLVVNKKERLTTAGANSSWQDLILHIIKSTTNERVADDTRRLFLIDNHESNQGAYSHCNLELTKADKEIAKAQSWLQANLAAALPVEQVLQQSALPDRTFKRRFKKHTGMTIIAYMQILRIDAAKTLLVNSNKSIDQIASDVGYQDSSYFRRIFSRETALSPSQYRRKWK
jgi:transcriptional regulator GlxA family with amidase domain